MRADEWYDWRANPRPNVNVLASLDESYYRPENPQDHPISWCHEQGKGRAWYTEMGHFKENYSEPELLDHIYGGLMWASQRPGHPGGKPAEWKSTKGWKSSDTTLDNSASVGSALVGKSAYGDCVVHADFKIPKGSNSGVYLQGRYEVQILDSWGVDPSKMTFSDCGSIYQRYDEKSQKGWEGNTAMTNAFAGPGQWNRFDILFKAPRFSGGRKVANAKFVEVRLNGVLIQKDVEVTGPTRASMFSDEKPTGPIMLQGDHGPIQFRNVVIAPAKL